jgi:hypothetical protein
VFAPLILDHRFHVLKIVSEDETWNTRQQAADCLPVAMDDFLFGKQNVTFIHSTSEMAMPSSSFSPFLSARCWFRLPGFGLCLCYAVAVLSPTSFPPPSSPSFPLLLSLSPCKFITESKSTSL